MKKIITLLCGLLLMTSATMYAAQVQFTVNGIKYETNSYTGVNGSTVKVIGAQNGGTTITVGGTVTYNGKTYTINAVDRFALRYNGYLKTVKVLGNYELGAGTFKGCNNITTVDMSGINDAYYTVEDSLFYGCYNLTSLKFPTSCLKISKNVFDGCNQLTELTINDVHSVIDPSAFTGCSSVKKITYNNQYTLNDPTNLINSLYESTLASVAPFYKIRNQITTAYVNTDKNGLVFAQMWNLTTVYIGTNVVKFQDKAFQNCPALTNIYLGTSTSDKLGGLKNIKWFHDACLYGCTNLTGKATLNGEGVEIAQYAFYNTGITALTIAPSASNTSIYVYDYAFQNCTALQTIELNGYVRDDNYFKKSAFSGCTAVKKVSLYGSHAASSSDYSYGSGGPITGLTNLEELVIDRDGDIFSYEFDGLSKLTKLTIGSKVKKVRGNAFTRCSSITTVSWNPSEVYNYTSEEESPFYPARSSLTSITFGSNVTEIPSFLLCNNRTLTSVTIPSGITAIGHHAFTNVPLTSISFPSSLRKIGSSAFYGNQMTNVTIPLGLEYIGEQAIVSNKPMTVQWNAQNCKFDYSNKIKGNGVFYPGSGDKSISAINFGSQVQNLPARLCFNALNLTSVTLPASLKSIGDSAFYNCSNLIYIESQANTPPTIASEKVFEGCNSSDPKGLKGITLVVPDQSLSLYKKAQYWKDFFETNEDIEEVMSNETLEGTRKVLMDGKVYIQRNDRLYDLNGTQVR